MARYGFIHDKLDMKLLILYFMCRVAAPVDFATVTGLTVCDDGIDYFDFAEALSELVDTGHLTLEDGLYAITQKGRDNSAICESSLPYSVRLQVERNIIQYNQRLRRNALCEHPFVLTAILPNERANETLVVLMSADRENVPVKRLVAVDHSALFLELRSAHGPESAADDARTADQRFAFEHENSSQAVLGGETGGGETCGASPYDHQIIDFPVRPSPHGRRQDKRSGQRSKNQISAMQRHIRKTKTKRIKAMLPRSAPAPGRSRATCTV